MTHLNAKFTVGQLVHHRLFDYRGVIVDVDAQFKLTEDWYNEVAQSKPPRDQPWYRVLVHDSDEITYVAEKNLESDGTGEPVDHPLVPEFFNEFHGEYYSDTRSVN